MYATTSLPTPLSRSRGRYLISAPPGHGLFQALSSDVACGQERAATYFHSVLPRAPVLVSTPHDSNTMSAVYHDVAETKQLIADPAAQLGALELETKASTPPTAACHTPMHPQLSGQPEKPDPPPTHAAYPVTHTPVGPNARGPSAKRSLKDRVSASRGPPPTTTTMNRPSPRPRVCAHACSPHRERTNCMARPCAPPPARPDRPSHRAASPPRFRSDGDGTVLPAAVRRRPQP